MQSHFSVEQRSEGDATMLVVTGELDLAASPTLEERLDHVFDGSTSQLIIDLRALEFIDSTGLSVLVKAHQRAEDAGRRFGLVNGGSQVRRLLSLTGIAERLTVADEPDELLGGS
ncbi:MAG TPA: STAS domain-containing protein [Solirubrobacteraceae bacterium]|jgi:anti-sigma B factor antagonist|nr:STAS domain-containing protein [Solirubrobacteraceae bacterium]